MKFCFFQEKNNRSRNETPTLSHTLSLKLLHKTPTYLLQLLWIKEICYTKLISFTFCSYFMYVDVSTFYVMRCDIFDVFLYVNVFLSYVFDDKSYKLLMILILLSYVVCFLRYVVLWVMLLIKEVVCCWAKLYVVLDKSSMLFKLCSWW